MRNTAKWWSAAVAALVIVSIVATVALTARQEDRPLSTAAEPELFPFVRSFAGTQPDGSIAGTSASIASADVLRFFEYYLAAIGEKPLPEIRAGIEREIDRQLDEDKRGPAKDLLMRYLDYKLALVDVEKQASPGAATLDAVRARFASMQETRRRFFSDAEIQAMFRDSDTYDEDAIARLEINANAALNEAQKREQLAALDAALPPALKEAKEAPYQVVRMEAEVQALRAQGASEDDIYRKRSQVFSPEAAARLAQVDREDREWMLRVQAYLTERAMLGAAGDEGVQRLRDSRFTAEEQRRLAAYEPG